MYRYARDEATLRKIPVHNPAKLFGFPDFGCTPFCGLLAYGAQQMVFSGCPPGVDEGVASANAVTSSRTQLTIRAKKLFEKLLDMRINASPGTTVPRSWAV